MEFTQSGKEPKAAEYKNASEIGDKKVPVKTPEGILRKEIENLGPFYENKYLLPQKNCSLDYILSHWFGNYFLLDSDLTYAAWLFPNITSYFPETKKPGNDRRLKESIMGGNHQKILEERASLQRIFSNVNALQRYFRGVIMLYDFFGLYITDFSTGSVRFSTSSDHTCSFMLQQNLFTDVQRATVPLRLGVPTTDELSLPGEQHKMSLLKQKILHLNYIKKSRFYVIFNSLIDVGFRNYAKSLLDVILRVSFQPEPKNNPSDTQSITVGMSQSISIHHNHSKIIFSKEMKSERFSDFLFICKRVLKYAMKDTEYQTHPACANFGKGDCEIFFSQLLLYYRKSKCSQISCGFSENYTDLETLRLGVSDCVSKLEKQDSSPNKFLASIEKERLDFKKRKDLECIKPSQEIMNILKSKVTEIVKIPNNNYTVSKLNFTIHNSIQDRIINKSGFMTIFDKRWFDDMVIHYYGGLVMKRSADYPNILPLVYVFSNYITLLMDDIKEFTETIQSTSSESIMTKIFDYKYLFIPFNDWNHWGLICIDLENMMIEIYDSMSGNKQAFEKHMASKAQKFLQLLYIVTKGETINVEKKFTTILKGTKGPQQENTSDCGVFVCKTMERRSIDAPLKFGMDYMNAFKNIYMPDLSESQGKYRQEIAKAKQLSNSCIENTRLNIAYEILTNQLINVPTPTQS